MGDFLTVAQDLLPLAIAAMLAVFAGRRNEPVQYLLAAASCLIEVTTTQLMPNPLRIVLAGWATYLGYQFVHHATETNA